MRKPTPHFVIVFLIIAVTACGLCVAGTAAMTAKLPVLLALALLALPFLLGPLAPTSTFEWTARDAALDYA